MKTQLPDHPSEPLTSSHSFKGIKRSSLVRYLKVFFFLGLGIFILWWITKNQDVSKIWAEFRSANIIWIVLAIITNIISHVVRAIRWNLLIAPLGKKPKLITTFNALMTGYLANLIVPRLGEISRCATLSRYSKIPFNGLIGTVVAERVVDLVTLVLLIFLTIVFQLEFLSGFLGKYVYYPALNLLEGNVILLVSLGLGSAILFALFLRYLSRVQSDSKSFSGKLKRQVVGFWNGLVSLRYLEQKFQFIILSFAIWMLYFMMVYLVFFALPGTAHLGVADGFTILTMGSLGVVAPVPGGVGTYHFIVITTMTELLGVVSESAVSYAYITHAVQTIIVIVLGGIAWVGLSIGAKGNKSEEKVL